MYKIRQKFHSRSKRRRLWLYTSPILTKLAVTKGHYVEIVHITFREEQQRNVESSGRNSFAHLKRRTNVPEPIFTKFTRDRLLVKNSETDSDKNSTNRLLVDPRSQISDQTDGQTDGLGLYVRTFRWVRNA